MTLNIPSPPNGCQKSACTSQHRESVALIIGVSNNHRKLASDLIAQSTLPDNVTVQNCDSHGNIMIVTPYKKPVSKENHPFLSVLHTISFIRFLLKDIPHTFAIGVSPAEVQCLLTEQYFPIEISKMTQKQIKECIVDPTELQGAIDEDRDSIALHYQPICRLDGSKVGAECLLRYRENGELKNPEAVMNAVALAGREREMRQNLLRQAFSFGAEARKQDPNFKIFFNTTPADLCSTDFVQDIEDIAGEYSFPLTNTEIEITEWTDPKRDETQFRANITALAEKGVSFAIDDFRTKPQFQAHQIEILRALKAINNGLRCSLKIDRSFIGDEAILEKYITEAFVNGAENLVFEGVEKDDDIERINRVYNKVLISNRPRFVKYMGELIDHLPHRIKESINRFLKTPNALFQGFHDKFGKAVAKEDFKFAPA